MDFKKIAYWVSTLLMCALFIFSAYMYFTNTEMIQSYFPSLGFPAWLVIPLAIVKILGVIAILTDASSLLREWAYAGFFFDVVMATSAHLHAQDDSHAMAAVGIVLVLLSRFLYKFRYID